MSSTAVVSSPSTTRNWLLKPVTWSSSRRTLGTRSETTAKNGSVWSVSTKVPATTPSSRLTVPKRRRAGDLAHGRSSDRPAGPGADNGNGGGFLEEKVLLHAALKFQEARDERCNATVFGGAGPDAVRAFQHRCELGGQLLVLLGELINDG